MFHQFKYRAAIDYSTIPQFKDSNMKEFGRFAELVFSPTKHLLAKSRLPGQTPGRKLTPDEVELVAKEALQWAKANGVTHYTFWVQPLTNRTIEKYDAFSELDYTHN